MKSMDAAADALARLEDDNMPTRARQLARGGEARGPRADDDDVYVIRGRSPPTATCARRGSARRWRFAWPDRRELGEGNPPRVRPVCCAWGGGGPRRFEGCVRTR